MRNANPRFKAAGVKTSESSVPEVRLNTNSPLNCPAIEPQQARAPKVKRNRLCDEEDSCPTYRSIPISKL